MTPPRIVCFDWGGVILRICRGWEEACGRAGLEVRPIDDGRARAMSERYQVGELEDDAYCEAIAEATGGVYAPGEVRMIHEAWLIEEYAGVGALIEDIHAAGRCETGLLSNTNAMHYRNQLHRHEGGTGRFPAARALHHRVASHLVGEAKPGEAIFRAFESLARCSPGEVLFFDDLGENVEAAERAGWRAVRVDHEGDPAAQMRGVLEELGVL